MDENESKEELKLLGNKRKIEHENFDPKNDDEKDINKFNNIENKDIINNTTEENKNKINLGDSSQKKSEDDKKLDIKEPIEEICPKCGNKNKLYCFKKGEDIYNYLLANKKGEKNDIYLLLEEKYKNIEFNPEKKICEKCIDDIIKDKNIFMHFFSNEQQEAKATNPENNIIKELEKNKNVEQNKKIENLQDNKKMHVVMPNANIIEQMQNRNNLNNLNNLNILPPYINPYAQNNPNIQFNAPYFDILQNVNNFRNLQNINQSINPNINQTNNQNINQNILNINNNSNVNKNASSKSKFR